MAKTTAEKIQSIQVEMQQLKNQEKQLIQKQKEQDRKDRTKRLCKRAGLLESLLLACRHVYLCHTQKGVQYWRYSTTA